MGDKSGISWCDATWNPVVGCTKVSQGCKNCYAHTLHDQRHAAFKEGRWDDAPAQYHKPFTEVQLLPERLELPLRWRRPRRVFVNSVSDLFHEQVPDEFVDRVFAVMALAERHTFQVLTKRPERMAEYTNDPLVTDRIVGQMAELLTQNPRWGHPAARPWPLLNVQLGTSVEDQPAADERVPHILRTLAAVRFLSCEPLLGELFLDDVRPPRDDGRPPGPSIDALRRTEHLFVEDDWSRNRVDWVIVGGESGRKWRPMDHDWARRIRDDCVAAGVPFFFKQSAGPVNERGKLLDGERWEQMPELATPAGVV